MIKQISKWNILNVLGLITGTIIAYIITILPSQVGNDNPLYLILSGAIAICAMILPGISGSFILLLLGTYQLVLSAIDEMNIFIILYIGVGAIIGLLLFSRLLNWVYKHYKNLMIAVLSGFLIGSLNKIWPWKEAVKSIVVKGKTKILEESNYLPETTDLPVAILWAAIGFTIIVVMERLAVKKPD